MNAPTLYSISAELNAILAAIEDAGGEITPETEQALTITEAQFIDKVTDYGKAILNLDALASMAKAEKDRLAALQKHYDNTAKRLREAVSNAMQTFDRPTVENGTMRLSLRHTTATEVDDVDALPQNFKTTKVEQVADKTAIKKAILAGEAVPGAHLVENINLLIK